ADDRGRAGGRARGGVMSVAPDAAPSRLSDLFASAVHRYGTVWADLLVASLGLLLLASLPVAVVKLAGAGAAAVANTSVASYAVAYFVFQAFVMLRGLPQRAAGARVAATYLTAVVTGLLAGVL